MSKDPDAGLDPSTVGSQVEGRCLTIRATEASHKILFLSNLSTSNMGLVLETLRSGVTCARHPVSLILYPLRRHALSACSISFRPSCSSLSVLLPPLPGAEGVAGGMGGLAGFQQVSCGCPLMVFPILTPHPFVLMSKKEVFLSSWVLGKFKVKTLPTSGRTHGSFLCQGCGWEH